MTFLKRLLGKNNTNTNANMGDEFYDQARDIYERGAQRINTAGELDEGLNLAHKAREEYRSANPKGSLEEAHTLSLEASIHRLLSNYEKAIDCHDKALIIVDKIEPHSILKAQFLNNQAELYRAKYNRGEIGSIQEMLDKGKSGYEGTVLIEALKYALDAVEEYKTRHPTNSGVISSLHTLGLVCRDFGDFDTAGSLLQMSTALSNIIRDPEMAELSLSCYKDVQDIKTQLKEYNLIRHRAFEHIDETQKKEVEELLTKARIVSEFKK
jgi:tetratricopeptide (TPR) repeat protein